MSQLWDKGRYTAYVSSKLDTKRLKKTLETRVDRPQALCRSDNISGANTVRHNTRRCCQTKELHQTITERHPPSQTQLTRRQPSSKPEAHWPTSNELRTAKELQPRTLPQRSSKPLSSCLIRQSALFLENILIDKHQV